MFYARLRPAAAPRLGGTSVHQLLSEHPRACTSNMRHWRLLCYSVGGGNKDDVERQRLACLATSTNTPRDPNDWSGLDRFAEVPLGTVNSFTVKSRPSALAHCLNKFALIASDMMDSIPWSRQSVSDSTINTVINSDIPASASSIRCRLKSVMILLMSSPGAASLILFFFFKSRSVGRRRELRSHRGLASHV